MKNRQNPHPIAKNHPTQPPQQPQNNHRLAQNLAQINTILWKSVPDSVEIRGKTTPHVAAVRQNKHRLIQNLAQINTIIVKIRAQFRGNPW